MSMAVSSIPKCASCKVPALLGSRLKQRAQPASRAGVRDRSVRARATVVLGVREIGGARGASFRQLARPVNASRRVNASSSTAEPTDSTGGLSENFVTAGYIALWYAVNVCFNLVNKTLYKSFPFPWTVSTVHVIVGSLYCLACYGLGFKKASFGRPITKEELVKISGPASMHAFGHIAANLSFAAVAISLTHTVKTLEPVSSLPNAKREREREGRNFLLITLFSFHRRP